MLKIKITDFYDEFRPYNETEALEAIKRLSDNDTFYSVYNYFFPDCSKEEFYILINSISSVDDFQRRIMKAILDVIIDKTTKGYTFSGLENINKDTNYVFISNHRDIVLDATFFQVLLLSSGFNTSEVTFGNNLMKNPLVYDIGKINKMFKVYRKGSPKELLKKTIQLSEYIRYTLMKKKRSVWIAQRGGRTKDGNDKTQNGIIKMLNSSGPGTLEENLKELNIVPLSISYEYEPNDHLKVFELLHTVNGQYEKKEGEDIQSIIDGALKQKGRIHLKIGKSISTGLNKIKKYSARNLQIAKITEIINYSIYENYKLWPNNYIAYDLLYKTALYEDFYTPDEKANFITYKKTQLQSINCATEKGKNLFLNIYANPVKNKFAH